MPDPIRHALILATTLLLPGALAATPHGNADELHAGGTAPDVDFPLASSGGSLLWSSHHGIETPWPALADAEAAASGRTDFAVAIERLPALQSGGDAALAMPQPVGAPLARFAYSGGIVHAEVGDLSAAAGSPDASYALRLDMPDLDLVLGENGYVRGHGSTEFAAAGGDWAVDLEATRYAAPTSGVAAHRGHVRHERGAAESRYVLTLTAADWERADPTASHHAPPDVHGQGWSGYGASLAWHGQSAGRRFALASYAVDYAHDPGAPATAPAPLDEGDVRWREDHAVYGIAGRLQGPAPGHAEAAWRLDIDVRRYDFDAPLFAGDAAGEPAGHATDPDSSLAALRSSALNLAYAWGETAELFARVRQGFDPVGGVAGTLLHGPSTASPLPPAMTAGSALDLGWRATLDDHLQLAATVWTLEPDPGLAAPDRRRDSPLETPLGARQGAELAMLWKPRPWLVIDADVAWTEALAGNAGGDEAAIERLVSLGISVDDTDRLSAGLRLQHLGQQGAMDHGEGDAFSATLLNGRVVLSLTEALAMRLEGVNLLGSDEPRAIFSRIVPSNGAPPGALDARALHRVEPRQLRLRLVGHF
jgi:hypothetical protein